MTSVHIGNNEFQVLHSLCYIGNVTARCGKCLDATTVFYNVPKKGFTNLFPETAEKKYTSIRSIKSVLLYDCKTWAV